MRLRIIALSATMLGLSACAVFERDPRTGYADTGYAAQVEDLYQERRQMKLNEVKEELGLEDKEMTDESRQAIEDRLRLKRLESKIGTRREKKQYFDMRSALKSDRERIYFLSLPTFEARQRWASARGIASQDSFSDDVATIVEANDIALGMTQKAVVASWGDPDAVETAGNPMYGYERWKYNRYVSGNDGYQKELRIVYFEGGRVVGWERN